MVRLTITPAMLEGLEYCQQHNLDISDQEISIKEVKSENPITHSQVVALSTALKKHMLDTEGPMPAKYTLAGLLRGSDVYIEPAKPRKEPVS